MFTIFLSTVRGHRYPVIITAALVAGYAILVAGSYETFGGSEVLSELMPKGVTALMKAEGSLLFGSGPQAYLAVGFRHPFFLIVLAAFAIATASGALAREIEHRTILILLARPLPRYHLVLARGLASFVLLAVLVLTMLVGTFIGVLMQGLGESIRHGPFIVVSFNALCLSMAVMGYSYLFSAISSDGGRAILLSTSATVVFFFLDFISGLLDVLSPLGVLSVFHYYDPVAVAVGGSFPALHVGVLLATGAATFGAAVLLFQRRDIAA